MRNGFEWRVCEPWWLPVVLISDLALPNADQWSGLHYIDQRVGRAQIIDWLPPFFSTSQRIWLQFLTTFAHKSYLRRNSVPTLWDVFSEWDSITKPREKKCFALRLCHTKDETALYSEAVISRFLGPRGPLIEPLSVHPSRPPVRNNFSWVHR